MPEEPDGLLDHLAAALDGRLPDDVLVIARDRTVGERVRGRPGRVTSLEVRDGFLYLVLEAGRTTRTPRAWIVREVHDVVISRRQAPLGAWLAQLGRTLRSMDLMTQEAQVAADDVLTRLGFPPPVERILVDHEDVLGGLEALPEQLYGRVPADVQEQVREICAVLGRALIRIDDADEAWAANKIATDYLPTTLRAYVDLPADWTDREGLAGGRDPADLLREQLDVLQTQAREAYQKTLDDDAARLVAHGAFLRERFGAEPSVLSLEADHGPLLADAAVVTARFRDLDRDGDGTLGPAELQGLMAGLGEPLDEDRALRLIAAVDRDGNGRVSERELIAFLAPGRP